MKDFSNTAAGKLIKKAADNQTANSFFRPDFNATYTLLDETKKIKVNGKDQERLQVVAEDGKLSLIPATALSGFFMTAESAGTNYEVIDGQTIDQAFAAISAGDGKFKFVEGDACLVYSRKFDEQKPEAREGEILIETSTKKFYMKPGNVWSIVKA